MEILDTMYLVRCIYSEWYPIKTLVADNTDEAVWVVGLACCSQDSVQDWRKTFAALFESVGVIRLAEWLAIYRVKW